MKSQATLRKSIGGLNREIPINIPNANNYRAQRKRNVQREKLAAIIEHARKRKAAENESDTGSAHAQ